MRRCTKCPPEGPSPDATLHERPTWRDLRRRDATQEALCEGAGPTQRCRGHPPGGCACNAKYRTTPPRGGFLLWCKDGRAWESASAHPAQARLKHPLLDHGIGRCHRYTMARSISIKELHRTTGEHVRQAAKSGSPIHVTDRGRPIAVLASPTLLMPKRRPRTLLAEYKALLSRKASGNVLEDLDAVRGDR